MNMAFPYRIDGRGRTGQATAPEHIRALLEQVLFTSPGERVNRPNFGSGILQMVFSPASPTLAAALQMSVQGALQQWLGDLIDVGDVEVAADEGTLHVTVSYRLRTGNSDPQSVEFTRPLA